MQTKLESTNCIRIRRLFDAAAGFTKLQESEHQHVHECQICQGPERQTSVAERIFSMRAKAVAKIRDTEPQP